MAYRNRRRRSTLSHVLEFLIYAVLIAGLYWFLMADGPRWLIDTVGPQLAGAAPAPVP